MSFTRIVIMLIFFAGGNLFAQTTEPRLIVGNVTACTGDVVTVPVITEGFTDVIDMVFNLDWDVDSLELLDVTYPQQDVLPLSYQYNATINKFSFASTDLISSPLTDATTLANGDTILLLQFTVKGESTNQPIQSTFFPSLFSLVLFNDNGSLGEADITIVPGGIFLENNCQTEVSIEPALSIGNVIACTGDTVKVPVTVENFTRAIDMVFHLDWDINSLELIGVDYPQEANLPLEYQFNEQINKYLFASTDLLDSPLNDTTTLIDGDTLILLQFVVLAPTGDQTIQSTFFPSLFSLLLLNDNGALSEVDITINPGTVGVTDELIELTIQVDTINCTNPQALLSVIAEEPAVTYDWFRRGTLVGQGDELSTTEGGEFELVANGTSYCRTRVQVEVPVDTILARPQVPEENISCQMNPVTLTVDDPREGYSYSWNNSTGVLATGPVYSTDISGDYHLITVNETNGCIDTSAVLVGTDTIRPTFSISISGPLGCENEEVELSINRVDPENQCTWLFAGDTISAECTMRVSLPGEYEALVLDATNGCVSDTLILVTESEDPPPINTLVPTSLNCSGNPVTLSVSNLETGENYEWFQEDGSSVGRGRSLPVDSPGTYSVSLLGASGTCRRTGTVEVFADTIPPSIFLAAADITCASPSVDLTFTSPTANLIGSWTTTDNVPLNNPVAQEPGMYRVVVTNPQNGCTTVDSLRVEMDTIPPVYTISERGEVTLNCQRTEEPISVNYDGDYSIAWIDPLGTMSTTTDSIIVADAGEVLLVVTNDENGCKDSTRLSVIVNESLPEVEIVAPAAFNCEEDEVFLTLTNNPSFNYEWNHLDGGLVTAVSSDSFLINLPGMLVLTTTDELTGCQSSDTINIAPNGGGLSFFGLSVTPPSCGSLLNASIILGEGRGGVEPYTYTLADRTYLPFEIIEDLAAGSYQLRLTDRTNCHKDTTIVIEPARPLQFTVVGGDQEIQLGDSIELSVRGNFEPQFSYDLDWIIGDSVCRGCNEVALLPLRSDNFSVNILRSDGCKLTLAGRFTVDSRPQIYLPTAFSPNNDGMNEVYLPLYGPQVEEILDFSVFSRWGEQLYRNPSERLDFSNGWDGTSNGKPLLPGVYIASVSFRLVDGSVHNISQSFNLLR